MYCTIPLIAMQGYHTKTEDTGSLDYNSICYITSRIGWVSNEGDLLSNNYCYTYLTKDQHPPASFFLCHVGP